MVMTAFRINDIALGGTSATHEEGEWLAQQFIEQNRIIKDQRAQLAEKNSSEEKLKRIQAIVDDILEGA